MASTLNILALGSDPRFDGDDITSSECSSVPLFTEDDDSAPWIDGSSSTLMVKTPSKKSVLLVFLLEYAGRYCLMSLQLILIESSGSNVRSIKLPFPPSSFCISSWKSDDKTAFQVKETRKFCLLKIFISES